MHTTRCPSRYPGELAALRYPPLTRRAIPARPNGTGPSSSTWVPGMVMLSILITDRVLPSRLPKRASVLIVQGDPDIQVVCPAERQDGLVLIEEGEPTNCPLRSLPTHGDRGHRQAPEVSKEGLQLARSSTSIVHQ